VLADSSSSWAFDSTRSSFLDGARILDIDFSFLHSRDLKHDLVILVRLQSFSGASEPTAGCDIAEWCSDFCFPPSRRVFNVVNLVSWTRYRYSVSNSVHPQVFLAFAILALLEVFVHEGLSYSATGSS